MPVCFEPWVGPNYSEGGMFGLRVLVLGESHYGSSADDRPSFTQDVVREFGYQKRDRFFTVVAKTVLPEDPAWLPDSRRRDFFDAIAFYNFVQRFPGDRPRQRPTEQMWRESFNPFQIVIEQLQPQVIVVLGKQLWWRLTSMPMTEAQVDHNRGRIIYQIGVGATALAGMVHHPSAPGFSYARWRPQVQALLAEAST